MSIQYNIVPNSINYSNLSLLLEIYNNKSISKNIPLTSDDNDSTINLISHHQRISIEDGILLEKSKVDLLDDIFKLNSKIHLNDNIVLKVAKPSFSAKNLLLFQFQHKRLQPLFQLSFPSEFADLVSLIHFFLSNNKLKYTTTTTTTNIFKLVTYNISDIHLELDRSTFKLNLSFIFDYSISLNQSIYSFMQNDVLLNLNKLMNLVCVPNPTNFQISCNSFSSPQSVSSFYSLITDYTRKFHNDLNTKYLNIPNINKTLLPFQVDSLKWMLNHEGMDLILKNDTDNDILIEKILLPNLLDDDDDDNIISKYLDKLTPGWTRFTNFSNNENYWFNPYSGAICCDEFIKNYLKYIIDKPIPAKGFLCEEMGLGKTLEIISLIQLNPRLSISTDIKNDLLDPTRKIKESKTTLILCPDTIIDQWFDEINSTSSTLNVNIYKGITFLEEIDSDITPSIAADILSNYDIILTSYNVLAKELDRAIFKPTTRPKRKSSNYERVDYSSPLMLLEFNRLVLDEAQLASISISRVAQFSRIIPRVHTWCVSGTIIRKDLQDLHSLINSQRLYPLDNLTNQQWNQLPRYLFDRIFQNICLRHTKEMVGNQVNLPKQTRIMLRSPFTTIENDNYYNLFNSFLQQVGLNDNGEPIGEGFDYERSKLGMRNWISKLRMACCHAFLNTSQNRRNLNLNLNLMTNLNSDLLDNDLMKNNKNKNKNKNKNSDDLIIGTLSDVLDDLINNNELESNLAFSSYIRNYIKLGKIKEFLRDPESSVKIFELVIDEINLKISYYKKYSDLETRNDRKKLWNSRIRTLQEFLHQSYFMLASAHFQHYRPMKPLPDNFDDFTQLEDDELNGEYDGKDDAEKIIDVESLNDEEKRHYYLENEYYSKADELLNLLLDDPLKKTYEMISKLNTTFENFKTYKINEIPTVNEINEVKDENDNDNVKKEKEEENLVKKVEELPLICEYFDDLSLDLKNHAISLGISFILNRANESMNQLNTQTTIINLWFKKLIEFQNIPVTKNEGSDKTGEEYKLSLISQEKSQAYIDQLQLILDDREKALNSTEDSLLTKSHKIQRVFNNPLELSLWKTNKNVLDEKLEKLRKYYIPQGTLNSRYSLRTSILELSGELQSILSGSLDYEQLEEIVKILKKELSKQMKNVRTMRTKLFDVLNDTFNSKVSYFKSLQIRSDNLVNYVPEKIGSSPKYSALVEISKIEKDLQKDESNIRSLNARLNYLKSLNTEREDGNSNAENSTDSDNLNDDSCVICRFRILVGTLTPCGHKYCRECIKEWLKTKKACPLCNKTLRIDELYNFTYSRGGLRGDVVESIHDNKEEIKFKKKEGEDDEEKEEDFDENENENENENEILDDEKDLDRIKLLKNRRLVEKDMDFVYEGLPNEQLRDISNIRLNKSYGTKIDMIIRQIKYLVLKEPDVQILIFSQWNLFLLLLGRAMKFENVEFRSWMDTKNNNNNNNNNNRWINKRNKGSNKRSKLNEDIEEFKHDCKITCFLLNTAAQAAGLTFTNASHVFLCEPMVNLSFELQAINRIHRIGQTKETTVWNFIIEGTIEESIAYLGTRKRIQSAKIRKSAMKEEKGRDEEEEEVEVEEIDDNVLEAKELTKINDINKTEGEVIADDDLWASFFAARSARVIDSVYK